MVVGGKQHHAGEGFQTLVHRLNGLHVQVVGGLVEQYHIGTAQHHLAQHTANLLAAGQNVHGLEHIFIGEQHPAKEAPEVHIVLLGRILAQPVHQLHLVTLKVGGVVLGKVRADGRHAPLDAALVRLDFAHEDLKEGRLGQLVLTHEGDLVGAVHGEIDLVQQLHAVHGQGYVLDGEHILTQLPILGKAHEGIAAGGAGHFFNRQLVQQFPAGGCLLGLGFIGGEALDEQL